MGNIFKNLFSHRHNLIQVPAIAMKDGINQEIVNAIGSCYDVLCQRLNELHTRFYYSQSSPFLQQDIERELWVHFANRRLSDFSQGTQYRVISDDLLTFGRLTWNRVLDLVEFICKWISINSVDHNDLGAILKEFEANINYEFDRLDYGYRIINHCVTDITTEEEMAAVNEAITNSKDNVRGHLESAINHYSARPNPDVRNSIKESISAVEAVCRELTGENTLGQALKHLEDNGVFIHKMLKEEFTKFYVYTNDKDSGIRHALMDDDGTYVPSKDEAYYMLVACSAFINFLRRKAASSQRDKETKGYQKT